MKSVSKCLIVAIVSLSSLLAFAGRSSSFILPSQIYLKPIQTILLAAKSSGGLLGWKVGDTLNFSMQMKPLPQKGTMVVKITSDTKEGIVMEEDVNLSLLKQKVEILFDSNTGEIKKMTTNGKPQQIPTSSGAKLVLEEEARITVPAGSFDCIHMVTEDADHQKSQTWLNPADLPIQGILKTKSEASILEVNTELTSFARGQ